MTAYQYTDSRIVVFAKAPVIGQVKTRLQAVLSMNETLRLYKRMLGHVWQMADGSGLCPVELWAASRPDDPYFAALTGGARVRLQYGDTLGQRMKNAAKQTLKEARAVVIIGGDCVSIDVPYLQQALEALHQEKSVVVGPATDGGYVLLGLTTTDLPIFEDVPWGSNEVMAVTRQRLCDADTDWMELPPRWDVDRPEDLERLDGLFR